MERGRIEPPSRVSISLKSPMPYPSPTVTLKLHCEQFWTFIVIVTFDLLRTLLRMRAYDLRTDRQGQLYIDIFSGSVPFQQWTNRSTRSLCHCTINNKQHCFTTMSSDFERRSLVMFVRVGGDNFGVASMSGYNNKVHAPPSISVFCPFR